MARLESPWLNASRPPDASTAVVISVFPAIYLTLKLFLRSGSLEAKYGNVVFLAISHTSIVWIL